MLVDGRSPMLSRALLLHLKHYARHTRYGVWRAMHRTGFRSVEVPPLLAGLDEALAWRSRRAQFPCPIGLVVFENAFRFGAEHWNPFSETARAIRTGDARDYSGSILARFYDAWQPTSAAAAVAGLASTASALNGFPPQGIHICPWRQKRPDEIMNEVHAWHLRDMSQQGHPYAPIEQVGFNRNGPVSDRLGAAEVVRLKKLLRSIAQNGYDRAAGSEIGEWGVRVEVLTRGNEVRLVNCGGVHRAAVMDALGETHVPAHLAEVNRIDRNGVDDWPHVRSGLWSRAEAMRYFDHLFDFDSRGWARERGLEHAPPPIDARRQDAPAKRRARLGTDARTA